MKYLITGGTGLVGGRLIPALLADGHEVHNLSRRARTSEHAALTHHKWNGKAVPETVPEVDVIINLAGASVGKRWTDAYKKLIYNSRIDATNACTKFIDAASHKPQVFISASGYNYYGNEFSNWVDEAAPAGKGFMPEICVDWEAAAQGTGVRTATLRTAVVLDAQEGPLAQMLTPYKFFVGGPTGTGKQGFPWIHLDDMVAAIRFIAETPAVSGPINMVAPGHGTMQDFSDAIAKVLSRPNFFRLPKFMLNLIFGEMAIILWGGGFVKPGVLEKHGFSWKYPKVEGALRDLLGDKLIPS